MIIISIFIKVVVIAIPVLVIPIRWIGIFEPMPLGAVNGSWSRRAINENQRGLVDSIEQLWELAPLIVRGEIIGIRQEVIGFGSYSVEYNLFSIYQLRLIDVLKGDYTEGSIIEIIQPRGFHGRSVLESVVTLRYRQHDPYRRPWSGNPVHIDYIRLPFNVGDDLILFLRGRESYPLNSAIRASGSMGSRRLFFSPTTTISHLGPIARQREYLNSLYILFNPIQAAYRYVASPQSSQNHPAFESINRYNNLILARYNL